MLGPNIIVAEPTELIGTGKTSDMDYVKASIEAVKSIDPEIMVLQGAGISNGNDVYNVIFAGAEATGSSSGVVKAKDQGGDGRRDDPCRSQSMGRQKQEVVRGLVCLSFIWRAAAAGTRNVRLYRPFFIFSFIFKF